MNLKLTISIFTFCLMANFVFGQAKIVNPEPAKVVKNTFVSPVPLSQARSIIEETLFPSIFDQDTVCTQGLFNFFNSGGWGYVGGMNNFGDVEKAQLLNYEDDDNNYTVTEAFAFIGVAEVIGDGEVVAKIYESTADGSGPGDLVGTSEPLKVSELEIDEEFALPTPFVFATPVQVTTNGFFVSLDMSKLYTSQDTVGILMTDTDCGVAGEAWELFSDGVTWLSIADPNSWDIGSNFFMAAIVESDGLSATKELVAGNQRISLHDAYPNPTNDQLTISYDLAKSAAIQIEIYSLTGQVIQQIDKNTLPAGQYQERISTKNLATGTYFYGIRTDSGRLMQKFSVGK